MGFGAILHASVMTLVNPICGSAKLWLRSLTNTVMPMLSVPTIDFLNATRVEAYGKLLRVAEATDLRLRERWL